LVNSNGVSGDQTLLNANTFTTYTNGSFKSAIELEGDNRNCQLQCNVFEVDNAADWRFVSNGTEVTLLDAQGTDPTIFVDVEDISESFSTTWYRNSGGSRNGYDISIDNYGNSTNDKVILYPDTENSSPDFIFNNVHYQEDVFESGLSFNCSNLIEGLVDDPPHPNCITHRYEMKNYARQTQVYLLADYLQCFQQIWSDKTLVGTYIGTNELPLARTTLESIPMDSEENLQFYDTYNEALTYLENGQTAGKSTAAMQALLEIAGKPDPRQRRGRTAALAESFLAAVKGINYTRSARSAKNVPIAQSAILASEFELQLFPNPANDFVNITVKKQSLNTGVLEIYSLEGKLLSSTNLNEDENTVNVQKLKAGLYICKYNNEDGKHFSNKLIINR